MDSVGTSLSFGGSIPQYYDAGLGPVIFEPYAIETASRVPWRSQLRVLEIAAGTGRVTNQLAKMMPADAQLVATDLNPDMLKIAQSKVGDPRVQWQVADAMALPFPDESFDCLVCQFGIMFYPDKEQGQREALRVLKPGGTYLFSVWGSHEENPWAAIVHDLVQREFPNDPPQFYKIPFGYCDETEIRRVLDLVGFEGVSLDWVDFPMVGSAREFAKGCVLGNPISNALRERLGDNLDPYVDMVAGLLANQFGDPLQSRQRALIVTAKKP